MVRIAWIEIEIDETWDETQPTTTWTTEMLGEPE